MKEIDIVRITQMGRFEAEVEEMMRQHDLLNADPRRWVGECSRRSRPRNVDTDETIVKFVVGCGGKGEDDVG